MRAFEIIDSPERGRKRVGAPEYARALDRFIEDHQLETNEMELRMWHAVDPVGFRQFLFLNVRHICYSGRDIRKSREILEKDEIVERYALILAVINMFSVLTPTELMQQYPVTKRYDGARWQGKDFYSVMEEMSKYDPKRAIVAQGNTLDVLFAYLNPDIGNFIVEYLQTASYMRQMQGLPGILEEWIESEGVSPIRIYPDKGYGYDPETRKTFALGKPAKKKPKWWKVVEGGQADEFD